MKPGSYTQLYIQVVFSPRGKQNLLNKDFRAELYRFMGGVLSNMKHTPIIINGVEDHIHIFFGLNPNVSISDTIRDIKRASSLLINEKNWLPNKFSWQEGYGAFSYSKSHIENVKKYIANQEEHHKKNTFKEEYIEFLDKYEVEYDKRFLFEFYN